MFEIGRLDAESAAFARLAIDRHFTAVAIDDLGDDGEAEADAVLFGGDEGVEDGFDFVGRECRSR